MQTTAPDAPRTLRPATPTTPTAAPAPGPFEGRRPGRAACMPSALFVGLLVLYPVVGAIAVILAGVVLGDISAGA